MENCDTSDTDALRELCKQAQGCFSTANWSVAPRGFQKLGEGVLPILDELDRLRAAEAASKEALAAAQRLAVFLAGEHWPENKVWRVADDLMGVILQIDNATAGLARAEIARLTDAGVEDFGTFIPPDQITDENLIRPYAELKPASASPPPAAADRGEPVAWRVKDFADGWMLFHTELEARNEYLDEGALIEPLYTLPASVPPASGDITHV